LPGTGRTVVGERLSGIAVTVPVSPRAAAWIFLAFALTYFFSALLRAVTATLAPVFSQELGLQAADLGLLAGAYFLGFSALQLPLGAALDRRGPRQVQLALMSVAVVGCAAFAMGQGLGSLFVARLLIGMGVAACLMAPLTCYRRCFGPAAQLRANSWMLMTGSLGMLASTLPVQALLPVIGWRGLFGALALCLLVGGVVIALAVPRDPPPATGGSHAGVLDGYGAVFRHPRFRRAAPLGFFLYGGMIAVQSLWAGPWLTQVAGWTAPEAAGGLFAINASMLVAFMAWGAVMPRLHARGLSVDRLIITGLPFSLLLLLGIAVWPQPAGAAVWALWCVSCTFVSLIQPAVAQAFDSALAGRALSAFNLVIFSGVFVLQWGIGLVIDALRDAGWSEAHAYRAAFGLFAAACVAAYLWFARGAPPTPSRPPAKAE
jgi:predicted MFS family arabinose efflux permease